MYLKPKNNTRQPKALLYRRFISLESSRNLKYLYQTDDSKYWTFDYDELGFVEFTETVPAGTTVVEIISTTVLTYLDYYMYYTTEWVVTESLDTTGYSLLSVAYNNVGKYQTNKYYYMGNFGYMIKGDVVNVIGQRIKGLIVPMENFTIRTFSDSVKIKPDDLVVIGKKLYSIGDIGTSIKKPANYKIYYATLNSIL